MAAAASSSGSVRVYEVPAPVAAASAAASPSPLEARVSALFQHYLPHLLEMAILQDHYQRGGGVLQPYREEIGLEPDFFERMSAAAYDKLFVGDSSESGTKYRDVSSWLKKKQAHFEFMMGEVNQLLAADVDSSVASFLSCFGSCCLYLLKGASEQTEPLYMSLRGRYQGEIAPKVFVGFFNARAELEAFLKKNFTLSEALEETLNGFLSDLIKTISLGYVFHIDPLQSGDKIYVRGEGVIYKSAASYGKLVQATLRTLSSIAGFNCNVESTVGWLKLCRDHLSVADKPFLPLEQHDEVRYFATFLRWATPFLRDFQKNLTILYQTYDKDKHLNLEYVECMSAINGLFETFHKRLAECEEMCQKLQFTLPRFTPDFTPNAYDEMPSEPDTSASAVGDDPEPSAPAAARAPSAADAPPAPDAEASSPPPEEEDADSA